MREINMELKPDLETLDEKCPLCGMNLLMCLDEPRRKQFGKWCPNCVNKGLDKYMV